MAAEDAVDDCSFDLGSLVIGCNVMVGGSRKKLKGPSLGSLVLA